MADVWTDRSIKDPLVCTGCLLNVLEDLCGHEDDWNKQDQSAGIERPYSLTSDILCEGRL